MADVSTTKSFFDDYELFYESTGRHSERLGARYDCLIRDLGHLVRGRTIIDLGSHDGRWSFAAVKAGAAHVLGIEPRADLVELAKRNFAAYGVPQSSYEFVCGDALEVLTSRQPRAETVFVFGVFYHISRHVDWAMQIVKTGARAIIIDTQITPCDGPFDHVVRYFPEATNELINATEEVAEGAGIAIVGHPSRGFISLLFRSTDYKLQEVDWTPYLDRWGRGRALGDYAEGKRSTFVGVRP
jgi:hypothetical protein